MKRESKQLTLSLNTSTTFIHEPSIGDAKLNADLIEHWKGLDGVEVLKGKKQRADYIPVEQDGTFQFPLKHYQEVLRSLSRYQADVKIHGIPPSTLAAIQHANGMAARAPPPEKLLEMVPGHILENLYDYQKEGVAFAVSRGGRVMLADEMGVGKSRQGLALLAVYQWEWPALILCPSSLKSQWRALIDEWLTPLTENVQFQQKYARFFTATADNRLVREVQTGKDSLDALVNIISYDLAGDEKKSRELAARNFQVCLLDESHNLKSRAAKRVKVLLPIIGKAKRIILLSGTPSLNRPAEIFPQMHMLRRDVFSSFHAFGERYCAAKKERFGWNYDGHSNLQELNVVLTTLCMIRRTKDEVLADLPPKHRERVVLTLTDEQRHLVEKGVENLRQVESQKNTDPAFSHARQAAFMTLWREIGKVKLPSVIEYIHGLLEQGTKFVLFAHHQFVLDELEAFLTRKNVRFIRIDGQTKSKHRQPMVDDFQTSSEVRVALLSITAAGVGIQLFAAHTVVFAELYWTCGALVQAEDRCHRLGQTEPVNVFYLLAENTADEKIWFILRRKMEIVGQMLGATSASGLQSSQSVYDEELTQTIMGEFISALIGTNDDSGAAEPPKDGTLDRFVQRTPVAKKRKKSSFVWNAPAITITTGEESVLSQVTSPILPKPQEYIFY